MNGRSSVFIFGATSPMWADYDDGMAAYWVSDYVTAPKELRVLSDQGDATDWYLCAPSHKNEQQDFLG